MKNRRPSSKVTSNLYAGFLVFAIAFSTTPLSVVSPNVAQAAAGSANKFAFAAFLKQSGSFANGTFNITVGIYDSLTGGTQLFTQNFPAAVVTDGLLILNIGPTPDNTFINNPTYFELDIGGTTLTPRLEVDGAPYAQIASQLMGKSTIGIQATSTAGFNLNPYGTAAGNTTELRFNELYANGSNYVGIKAPDNIASNYTLVLPNSAPGAGQAIISDGAGNLSFGFVSAGTSVAIGASESPAYQIQQGANPYFQINTSGTPAVLFGNATTNPSFAFQGTGSASFGGSLSVIGTATAAGFTAPYAALTALTVSGTSTHSGLSSAYIASSTLNNSGTLTTAGLNVTTFGQLAALNVSGPTALQTTLSVGGLATLSSFVSQGSSTIVGTATASVGVSTPFISVGALNSSATITAPGINSTNFLQSVTQNNTGSITTGGLSSSYISANSGIANTSGTTTSPGFSGNYLALTAGLATTSGTISSPGVSSTNFLQANVFNASAAATLQSTLSVGGLASLSGFVSNGSSTVVGNFTTTGTGQFANLYVSGSTTFVGTASFSSGLALGSYTPAVTADMLYGSGGNLYFNGNQIPSAASVWSLTGNTINSNINFLGSSNAADLVFKTSNATATVITAAGNFGIGVAAPVYKLQVAGTIAPSADITYDLGSPTNQWRDLYVGSSSIKIGGVSLSGVNGSTNGVLTWAGQGINVSNGTASFNNGTFSGNLGVGTTTPAARLTVQGAAGADIVQFADSTGAGKMILNSNGALAIGTSTAFANLDVNGVGASFIVHDNAGPTFRVVSSGGNNFIQSGTFNTAGTFADLYFSPMYQSGPYLMIKSGGNIGMGTNTPSAKLSVQGGVSGDVLNWSNSTGSVLGVINNSGNLGIGTTSPASILSVAGSSYFTGNIGIGTNNPTSKIHIVSAAGESAGITLNNTDLNSTTNPFIAFEEAGVNNWVLYSDSDDGNKLKLYNNATFQSEMVFNSAGNLGLGTENPIAALDLATGSLLVQGGNIGLGTASTSGRLLVQGVGASNIMTFANTAGSLLGVINSTGNLGLGTTNPGFKLEVAGTIAPTTDLSFDLGSPTRQWRELYVGSSSVYIGGVPLSANQGQLVWNGSGFNFGSTGTASGANATFTGSVGIGTTNPGAKLEVQGVSGDIAYFGNGSYTGKIGLDGTGMYFNHNSATRNLSFGVNGSRDNLVISTAGNLGIGTTNPGAKLSFGTGGVGVRTLALYDQGDASNNFGFGINSGEMQAYVPVGGRMTFNSGGTLQTSGTNELMRIVSSGNVSIGTTTSSGRFVVQGGGADIGQWYDSSGSGKMVLTNAGNLGIGTTSPSALLSVAGNGYVTGNVGIGVASPVGVLHIATTNTRQILLNNSTIGTNNSDGTFIGEDTSGGFNIINQETGDMNLTTGSNMNLKSGAGASGSGALILRADGGWSMGTSSSTNTGLIQSSGTLPFWSGTSEVFRITTSGNLNLGTSSNYGKFSVQGGGGNLLDIFDNTGAEKVTILNSGNLGIGNTGPAYKLDVNGAIATNAIAGAGRANTTVLDNVGANGRARLLSFGQDASTKGSIEFYQASSDNSINAVGMILNNQGNLGIGTTNPGALLEVNKNQNAETALYVLNSNAGASASSGIVVGESASGGNYGGVFHYGAGHTPAAVFDMANTSVLYGGDISGLNLVTNTSSAPIRFFTHNGVSIGERVRLDNNGNLGIGTTSPSSTLAVNGSALISGTITVTACVGCQNGSGQWLTSGSNLYYSTGNIGIGTDTPSAPLAVAGNVLFNHILPNGAYTNNLSAYDLGSTNQRWNALWAGTLNIGTSTHSIKADSNSNLGFYTAASGGGTEAMVLTSSGNLGIGTTSPGAIVDITATGEVLNTTSYGISTSLIRMKAARGTTASPSAIQSGDWLGGFAFQGYGATGFSAISRGIIAVQAAENWTDTAQGTDIRFQTTAAGGTTRNEKLRITSSGGLALGNAYVATDPGVGSMIMTGNLGIGTTSPGYTLHVKNSGSDQIVAESSGTGGFTGARFITPTGMVSSVGVGGSTNGVVPDKFAIFHNSGTTPRLVIDTTGNLGIGTTNPTQKFQVTADMDYNNSASSLTQFVITGSSNTNKRISMGYDTTDNFGLIGAWDNSSTWTDLALQPNDVTGIPNVMIKGNGNVGIGTTTPAGRLAVQGAAGTDIVSYANASGSVIGVLNSSGNLGIGTTNPGQKLHIASNNTTSSALTIESTDTGGRPWSIGVSGSANGLVTGAGIFHIYDATANAVRMAINTSGNLGVGTTAPYSNLAVYNTTGSSDVNIFALASAVGGANNTKFRVDSDGDVFSDGTDNLGGGADYAESYIAADNYKGGTVVMLDASQGVAPYVFGSSTSSVLLGVISTKPAVNINANVEPTPSHPYVLPVALLGKVPVKVTSEFGLIKAGDSLVPSKTKSGYATKATQAAVSLGVALEDQQPDTDIVLTYVKISQFIPEVATLLQNAGADAQAQELSDLNMLDASAFGKLYVADKLYVAGDVIIKGTLTAENVKANDKVQGKQLCAEDICITKDQLKKVLESLGEQSTSPGATNSTYTPGPAPTGPAPEPEHQPAEESPETEVSETPPPQEIPEGPSTP